MWAGLAAASVASTTCPAECQRSTNLATGLPDGRIDVLRADVNRHANVLFRPQGGPFERLLHGALPHHDQGGLPVIDDLPKLLDVGPGHAAPQMAADPANG